MTCRVRLPSVGGDRTKDGDEEETEEKGTFDSYYFINGQSHVAVAVEDD